MREKKDDKSKKDALQAECTRCAQDHLRGLDNPILDKWDILKTIGEYVKDESSQRMVFHVRSFPLFIQAIGSVKYNCSRRKIDNKRCAVETRIFYRGQNFLMANDMPFQPSLYRTRKNKCNADKYIGTQIKVLQDFSENMRNLDRRVVEGVLQHYGMSSRWIDAVDNIWTALWFACHKAWSGNKNPEYVHYERRNPYAESAKCPYCYILLLGVEANGMTNQNISGFLGNDRFEMLDLRYALPSFYIRPHVQHGVLLRSMESKGSPMFDMSCLLKSIIRIDLQDALEWLGEGRSVTTSSVFPSPAFDTGYDELLRTERNIKDKIEKMCGKNNAEAKSTVKRLRQANIILQRIC